MPMLLDHIDKIARDKKRDVIFVEFAKCSHRRTKKGQEKWETLPERMQVTAYLDQIGVAWKPCGEIASESGYSAYAGQIYIDHPYDEDDTVYQKIQDYFERPDGTMKDPDVTLWLVTLELANKNAHHDEPGFWERWAENF